MVGAKVQPLPLSVADVSAVVDAYGCAMPREMLDSCVFALDHEWMAAL